MGKVVLESDATNLVSALQSEEYDRSTIGALVKEGRYLLASSFAYSKVIPCKRSCNKGRKILVDLPYAVRVNPATGEVTTLGRCDFNGEVTVGMTGHPKKDPVTGELFAFGYSIVPPFITYFRFDRAGKKVTADVPIPSAHRASMLHDFAITERYAVFPQLQLVMKLMDMVVRAGAPVRFDTAVVLRLGVLLRYAADDSRMRWFDIPGFNMLHTGNAWEEEDVADAGDEVVLVAPNVQCMENVLGPIELMQSRVKMVRVNLRTGDASRTALSPENLDFGVVNQRYIGRRNRFSYFGRCDPTLKMAGIVKLDFDRVGSTGDCTVVQREFGPRRFVGEPFFVPDDVDGEGNEDDGYLVCFVHDEGSGDSSFLVMDARSPELDIVAEVALPARVPYGFHAMFLTQDEPLSQQQ